MDIEKERDIVVHIINGKTWSSSNVDMVFTSLTHQKQQTLITFPLFITIQYTKAC